MSDDTIDVWAANMQLEAENARLIKLLSDTNTYYAECIAEREDLRDELAEKDKQTKAMDDMLRETTHHFMRVDLENRRLREALRPLAARITAFHKSAPDDHDVEVTAGEVRAARKAMGDSDE